MTPYQAATMGGLSPFARLLVQILDRKARGHAECWCSNETLSGALGCCQRTIRNALKALEASGLVQVVRDYSLRSRRRIVLLWKRTCDSFASMAANTDAQVAANPACDDSFPPKNPPVNYLEGERMGLSGGDPAQPSAEKYIEPPPLLDETYFPTEIDVPIAPEPVAGPIPQPESAPVADAGLAPQAASPPVEEPPVPAPRKATPEQVAATVEEAEKLFGPAGWVRDWVVRSARETVRVGQEVRHRGIAALRAGVAKGLAKVAAGGTASTGYVVRAADGMLLDGGPPPELALRGIAALDRPAPPTAAAPAPRRETIGERRERDLKEQLRRMKEIDRANRGR